MGLALQPFIPSVAKDPQSSEPQGIDWTAFLAKLGASVVIATSAWSVSGPDAALTITGEVLEAGSLRTHAIFSGGTPGAQYLITNRITTTSTPVVQDDRSFVLVINDR